jgi:hypothetical protein
VSLDNNESGAFSATSVADVLHLVILGASGLARRYPLLLAQTGAGDTYGQQEVYLPSYRTNSEHYLQWTGNAAPKAAITLDQDPLPESIEVTRNGLPETAFTWDSAQKSLDFVVPIQANEAITVTYDLANSSGGSRTLQFAQANTWQLDPATTLDAAVGFDWPIDKPVPGSSGTDVGRI